MTVPKCCLICGQPKRHLVSGKLVRSTIAKLIQSNHPEWNEQSFICLDDVNDVNQFGRQYSARMADVRKGE
jgi:hypothetical protein